MNRDCKNLMAIHRVVFDRYNSTEKNKIGEKNKRHTVAAL